MTSKENLGFSVTSLKVEGCVYGDEGAVRGRVRRMVWRRQVSYGYACQIKLCTREGRAAMARRGRLAPPWMQGMTCFVHTVGARGFCSHLRPNPRIKGGFTERGTSEVGPSELHGKL